MNVMNVVTFQLYLTIGNMPKLRNVHIVTNAYTDCAASPVDYR